MGHLPTTRTGMSRNRTTSATWSTVLTFCPEMVSWNRHHHKFHLFSFSGCERRFEIKLSDGNKPSTCMCVKVQEYISESLLVHVGLLMTSMVLCW